MIDRRYPIGPQVEASGVHFRVWAPDHRSVNVVIEGNKSSQLASEGNGYFSSQVGSLKAGDRYRLQLDNSTPVPDPASWFQPDGPHGPSQVIDSQSFPWTDASALLLIPSDRNVVALISGLGLLIRFLE